MTGSASASLWVRRVIMLARRWFTDRPLLIIRRPRWSITNRRRLSTTNQLRCITVPVGMLDTMMDRVFPMNRAIIAADMGMATMTTTIDRRPLYLSGLLIVTGS